MVGRLDRAKIPRAQVPSVASLVRLRTLRDFAEDWSHPVAHDDRGLVVVEPRLIRRVGRSGALIDARLADPTASNKAHQIVSVDGDVAGFVADAARRLGPRPFARRTGLSLSVAKRAVRGQRISRANRARAVRALQTVKEATTCAIDDCDETVPRPNAVYCGTAHSKLAYRQRVKERTAATAEGPTCSKCGCLMLGGADGRHGLCIDCEEKGTAS